MHECVDETLMELKVHICVDETMLESSDWLCAGIESACICVNVKIIWLCSESMIRCRDYIVCSKITIPYRIWVVYNELAFIVKSVLSAANQRSLPKRCCLQWICDLLPKLSCLQRITICYWKCVFCSKSALVAKKVLSAMNLWFIAKFELSAVNHHLLLKVCVLQWICD